MLLFFVLVVAVVVVLMLMEAVALWQLVVYGGTGTTFSGGSGGGGADVRDANKTAGKGINGLPGSGYGSNALSGEIGGGLLICVCKNSQGEGILDCSGSDAKTLTSAGAARRRCRRRINLCNI